jgi:hypothetical protein
VVVLTSNSQSIHLTVVIITTNNTHQLTSPHASLHQLSSLFFLPSSFPFPSPLSLFTMIVYYDIIADKEIASDSYENSLPAPGVRAIQSKKITISDDVGIASNADDEGDEGAAADALDDAAQTVINVVYSAKLTQVNLDKKEYKTLQKAYWKKLIDTLNELKWSTAHSHTLLYTPPAPRLVCQSWLHRQN